MVTNRKRLWVLLFAVVAILAVILLAASFRDLEFSEGRPLSWLRGAESEMGSGATSSRSKFFEYVYTALYFLAILLLPFSIIYVILSPEARKRVLKNLGLLLWLIALVLLMIKRPEFFEQLQGQGGEQWPLEDVPFPEVELAAAPSDALVWLITLIFALLIAAGLVAVVWFVWNRTRRPSGPLEQLSQEAQEALRALQAGADLKDTVLRCYFEMSRILMEQRGIVRDEAMTPREFEESLGQAGLPDEPVRQLTRLFEAVRYGTLVPGGLQERQAVDCLNAIAKACERAM